MAEGSVERREITSGRWSKQLDDSLTWVRLTGHRDLGSQPPWWPGLDQQISDFHARYERACVED